MRTKCVEMWRGEGVRYIYGTYDSMTESHVKFKVVVTLEKDISEWIHFCKIKTRMMRNVAQVAFQRM